MQRTTIIVLGGLMTLVGACDSGKTNLELGPQRGGWETVVDSEFPYLDAEGMAQITSITIGRGASDDDNFANRGDVVVTFDGSPDTIKVEMRKFAWVESDADADAAYDKLTLWAYNTGLENPNPEADDANNCNAEGGTWLDGCGVFVYYAGQLEPVRFGADLKVTMPSNYKHLVNVRTSDNDFAEDYLNRGNVCVEGIDGSVDVEMEQGVAFMVLADDAVASPTCSDADVMACDDQGDPAGSEAWGTGCPCHNVGFGKADVETSGQSAANVTFDIPAGLWTAFNLENSGENQDNSGHHCEAVIDVDGAEIMQDTSTPWRATGEANPPSPEAVKGAGFNIRGAVTDCAPVRYTEDPGDFVGDGRGDEQPTEDRGNIELCEGCVRDKSCDQLLPGK